MQQHCNVYPPPPSDTPKGSKKCLFGLYLLACLLSDCNCENRLVDTEPTPAPELIPLRENNPTITRPEPEKSGEPDEAALRKAANNGDLKRVKELVELGTDVNAQDDEGGWGMTPLTWAAYRGHKDVVEYLLEQKADINKPCKLGQTALWDAANLGHSGIVKLLLDNGADPDIQDKDGFTALMRAAHHHETDAVRLLLTKKANKNLKDKDGHKAIVYAKKRNKEDIVKLLEGKN